jgi:hypothetical protein
LWGLRETRGSNGSSHEKNEGTVTVRRDSALHSMWVHHRLRADHAQWRRLTSTPPRRPRTSATAAARRRERYPDHLHSVRPLVDPGWLHQRQHRQGHAEALRQRVTTAGSFNVDYVSGTWSEKTISADLAPALGTTLVSSVPLTNANVHDYILIDITPAVGAWLGRALQGMVRPFPAEMMPGQATQLAVYQRKQGLERFLVPALPFQQQLCDLIRRGFRQTWLRFGVSNPCSGRDSILAFNESRCS